MGFCTPRHTVIEAKKKKKKMEWAERSGGVGKEKSKSMLADHVITGAGDLLVIDVINAARTDRIQLVLLLLELMFFEKTVITN